MSYDDRHNEVRRRDVTVMADDGTGLAATWFERHTSPTAHGSPALPGHRDALEVPNSPAHRGIVVIAGAMATPPSYYAAFAAGLAARGFRALTWEPRGTADRAAMRAEKGDLLRWFDDARDVLDHALGEAAGAPVSWVGHSLGGQMLPFVDHDRLDRAVTVAAGSGYWRLARPGLRWQAPLMFALAPAVIGVAGYFPGRTLRVFDDAPGGVLRQWVRWCRDPDYLAVDVPDAESRFAAVKTPLTVLSFTDDALISAAAHDDLHRRYVNADQVRQRYSPAQLEVEQMGHQGFFRARHQALWDELVVPYLAT